MAYQDPYNPYLSQQTNQNNDQGAWYDNSGGQRQGDYGFEDTSRHQELQDYSQSYQWTTGDPGDSDKSRVQSYPQEPIDGYSSYQYPPFHSNRRTSQKTVSGLSKKEPSVPIPLHVSQGQYMRVNNKSGFANGEYMSKRRTPSAYREYRYEHQGRLWTKNGPLRTAGRFCLCTVLTALFLVSTIILSLVLWIRPPNVQIGNVQSIGGLQKMPGEGFQANLSVVIAVKNFNYFDVDMRKIQVEVFYPINNVPVGGGTANDITFKSGTQTNFTFPFSLMYNPSNDASGQVLADIAKKCGVGGQKSDIRVTYKLTLGIRILLFTVAPVVSNVFSFACPVSSSDISKIFGST